MFSFTFSRQNLVLLGHKNFFKSNDVIQCTKPTTKLFVECKRAWGLKVLLYGSLKLFRVLLAQVLF